MLNYREKHRIREEARLRASEEKNECTPTNKKAITFIRYAATSIILPTLVASVFSVFATTYVSCEEHLSDDAQKFERILVEIDDRTNSVALNLSGQSIEALGKPQVADAEMKKYEVYFTDSAPSTMAEFKGRSFNDLNLSLYQISSKWYRLGDSIDSHGISLHPFHTHLQFARFMFASIITYNKNKSAGALNEALANARAFLASNQSWRSRDNRVHSIRTLGASCPRWRNGTEATNFLMTDLNASQIGK